MRYFVITGHRAVSTGDFKLDDIAGGAGRLDILCRCVNSAFFLSHNLRKDVEIYLCLMGGDDPPKTVIFKGDELRYLNPDERSTASLIRNALLKPVGADEEVRSSPGVYVTRMPFSEVLRKLSGKGSFVAAQDPALLREANLRLAEDGIRRAVEVARRSSITKEELLEMVDILYDGD